VTSRRRRHGVPGEPLDPVPVGDALAAVSAELGLADPGVVGALTARWSEIVGDAIATHATLRAIRGATLTIAVDSGAWASQLRYLEADILARVATIVGDGVVDTVRVVVVPREDGS
jgi:predicted nucleic acid-binding Zn ribbon protein